MPPSAAAIDATAAATRCANTASASFAAGSRRRARARRRALLPESPSRPGLRLERALDLLERRASRAQEMQDDLGVDRARARRHRHAFERAEAHRRVDRPAVAHGGHRAAAAEVADDEPRRRAPARPPTAPTARGTRSGGCPTRRASAPGSAYVDASSGIVRVERRVEDGDVRDVRAAPSSRRRSPRAPARCAAAPGRRPRRAPPSTPSSTTTGSPKRAPPWTTRCATASTCAVRSNESTGRDASSPSTIESLRLVEPALTTRIELTRARPGPVADLRVVLAVLARVRARAQARVVHLLPDVRGPLAERRHAVDHVDHEMEAVEVVQHHHVERRRRRALLLVAAHVQVVVVRAPVRQPVDQPRIAVVREDDGAVDREERVELRVGEAVRMLALRLEAHQVDDVDDAHLQLGETIAQDRGGGERLERRHVAAAGEHDVGLAASSSFDAQSQMPTPRVQCTIASSIDR